jgi:methylmalonyl-CoA mutase
MNFKDPLTFEEFKEISYEAWKAQALKELKQDTLESLDWKTSRNIPAGPYYDNSAVSHLDPFHQHINPPDDYAPDARSWENRQLINYSDDGSTNKKIMQALEGGADGIIISTNNKGIAFEKLLKEVKLSYCSISFFTNEPEIISNYLRYCQSTGEYEKISGGVFWNSITAATSGIKTLAANDAPPDFRYSGFSDKYSLIEQFNAIVKLAESFPEEDLISMFKSRLTFTLNIHEDYFQGLALIKAARILSYQIIRSFNVDLLPEDIFIQAFSPVYKNEKYGPHENMLKSTTAAMAAIIGGCNGLVVMPENEESPFMQRIARNVSHVLKEEAYLGKVVDPSAGSYFIDHLVEQTVKYIWQQFQDQQNQNK